MSGLRSVVTEDWQRDALRVVLVNPDARQVAVVTSEHPGVTPMLVMMSYDPEAMTSDDEKETGILLPLAVARELYDALGRHFGVVPEPASRELVDVLKDVQAREAERVDHMIGVLTMVPPQRRVDGAQ